jgi:hypothetical protein
MALFFRCQWNIAAWFGTTQPNFQNLSRLHLVQRKPHKHKSHRTGFRNNINGLIWLWDGVVHSYGCGHDDEFFFLNRLNKSAIQ